MNYLKQLRAFKDWMLLNDLPTSAIALWHTLMAINNMTGWKERFNAPNSTVEKLSGLSKQGLDNARRKLLEKGLIEYEKGKKGQAPTYKIISLVDESVNSFDQSNDQSTYQSNDQSNYQSNNQSTYQSNDQSNYQSNNQSDDENLTIPKHKQNETKKIPYVEIIDYLNQKTGKNFRHSTKATKDKIKARWNDGYRLKDFKQVIDIKVNQWMGDPKMQAYLRPETLFGTKFESYLNQSINPNKQNLEIVRKQQEKISFDMEIERNRWVEKHGTINGFADYWNQLTS